MKHKNTLMPVFFGVLLLVITTDLLFTFLNLSMCLKVYLHRPITNISCRWYLKKLLLELPPSTSSSANETNLLTSSRDCVFMSFIFKKLVLQQRKYFTLSPIKKKKHLLIKKVKSFQKSLKSLNPE